jgi:hypothetical protein
MMNRVFPIYSPFPLTATIWSIDYLGARGTFLDAYDAEMLSCNHTADLFDKEDLSSFDEAHGRVIGILYIEARHTVPIETAPGVR